MNDIRLETRQGICSDPLSAAERNWFRDELFNGEDDVTAVPGRSVSDWNVLLRCKGRNVSFAFLSAKVVRKTAEGNTDDSCCDSR